MYGIPHTIHVWYIYLHLVDFYILNVGKYTSPMDAMGTQHVSWKSNMYVYMFPNNMNTFWEFRSSKLLRPMTPLYPSWLVNQHPLTYPPQT